MYSLASRTARHRKSPPRASTARARVHGDRDTSMATFLNMFKKIAGVCRPVPTYQFHTRWQSVPHTWLEFIGVPCKTTVRPWSCWGRTGNFSPGRQCVTPQGVRRLVGCWTNPVLFYKCYPGYKICTRAFDVPT